MQPKSLRGETDEERAIQPELAIALAHFAQAFNRQQHALPRWLKDSLAAYGIACCRRGVELAHRRRTLKRPPWEDEETPIEIRFDDEDTPIR